MLKLLNTGRVDGNQSAVTDLSAAYETLAVHGGFPKIKSGTAPYNDEDASITVIGDEVTIESYTAEDGEATLREIRRFEEATASQLRIGRDGSLDVLMPSTFLELPRFYVEVSDGTAPVTSVGPATVCGLRFRGGDEKSLDDVAQAIISPPADTDGTFTATTWTGTPLTGDNYLSVRVSKLKLTADLSSIRVRWPSGVDDNAGVALIPPNAAGDAPDWGRCPVCVGQAGRLHHLLLDQRRDDAVVTHLGVVGIAGDGHGRALACRGGWRAALGDRTAGERQRQLLRIELVEPVVGGERRIVYMAPQSGIAAAIL